MENTKKTLTINGHEVEIGSEKNLLEMIRKIGIELPTFCYHSVSASSRSRGAASWHPVPRLLKPE